MLRHLKPVVCGKDTGGQAGRVGCGGSIKEGRQAGLRASSALGYAPRSPPYGNWSLQRAVQQVESATSVVAGGTLRPGAEINHKDSRDGCSLGHCYGVAENKVAEYKPQNFVSRRSPCGTGWQQQAVAIGLYIQSFCFNLAMVCLPCHGAAVCVLGSHSPHSGSRGTISSICPHPG